MTREYQGFPISNFRVGFDEALEPWLIPRDAYQILKNAHLYRGVLEKIPGMNLYASMSYKVTIELDGDIDGVNTVFTGTLSPLPSTSTFHAYAAINSMGTAAETFDTSGDSGTQDVVDLVSDLGGTGTVNLTTGAVSLTFNTPPAEIPGGGNIYNAVVFTYDALASDLGSDLDIMGIKPYYESNGAQQILVFTTRRMGTVITLDGYAAALQGVDNGIEEVPHEIHEQATTVTPPFDGFAVTFTGTYGSPVIPGTISMVLYNASHVVQSTITDNGSNLLTGTGTNTATGFINYFTGDFTLTFNAAPANTDFLNIVASAYGDVFTGDYTNFFSVANYTYKAFITNNVDNIRYYDGTTLHYLDTNLTAKPWSFTYDISRCLHVFIYRERLLLILPTVNGSQEQNNIYWSVAGDPLDFTNAEFLLAPTSEPIRAIGLINSDLIVRFANSERIFRYTGDAFAPFRWDSTNNIFRCDTNYSAINYDSYLTSVGKPAIVASDGVNVQRADEILPDFTLDNRALSDTPIISIQQTSIGQCYGERFDDFKEGWLCFKQNDANDSSTVQRSDNVLAYNYLDDTYAVYTFPLNCLGFGTVTSVDTWGNNFTPWEEANYAWSTFFESLGALIDLGGDRYGNVYTLGNGNTYVDVDGEEQPVQFDVITKNFNPFIEGGELVRFGYLDLFVSANAQTKLRVQFYRDDTLYEGPDGNPAGFYQETTLTFSPFDGMSPTTPQTKIWKRIYVGAVAKEHTIRFYQSPDDFTPDTLNQPVRIHAIVPYMKAAGRIFN